MLRKALRYRDTKKALLNFSDVFFLHHDLATLFLASLSTVN